MIGRWLLPLQILLGTAVLLELYILSINVLYADALMPKLVLGGVEVGGLPFDAAQARIQAETARFFSKPVEFIPPGGGVPIKLLPRELGISFDINASMDSLRFYGRSGSLWKDIKDQLLLIFHRKRFPIAYEIDNSSFSDAQHSFFAKLENPARNFSYEMRLENGEPVFMPRAAREGRVVDGEKIQRSLEEAAAQLQNNARIAIEMRKEEPLVREDANGFAKREAERILKNAPYALVSEDGKWEISSEQLIQWLEFMPEKSASGDMRLRPSIDEQSAEVFFSHIAAMVNRDPVNAQFEMKQGRVAAFVLSRDGISMDIAKTIKAFEKSLLKGEKETALAVSRTEPEVTTEKINSLGISALIGRGISDFSGSPKNRIHNIRVGAAKYNGLLIKPGEEFSFIEHMGEISSRGGYLPSLVIKKNKTVAEYGGGLCQVSTTAFRAAINSGLEITQRRPHAFPVKYYDPQGFDASVYAPYLDLKFINNTPGHILIQTRVEGTKLIFEFFGTDDGREVEMLGPFEYDRKPDGSLKAYFIRRIKRNGKIIKEEKFSSKYNSPVLYPVERNLLE